MGIPLKLLERKKDTKPSGKEISFSNILQKEIHLFGTGVRDRVKESFYLELGMLLSAGIDISNALDLILYEKQKKEVQAVFYKIKEDIVNGASLSTALRSTGKFSEYEYYSIQIGEEIGKLPEILADLSSYYGKKIKQKRQLITALTYPAIVTVFALSAVVFMLNFVVPMFSDVFKRFGGELPGITQFILRLSDSVRSGFWVFFFALLAGIILLRRQRNKTWFRRLSGKIILNTPVIGKLIHKIYLSRFCNSMHLMISSRVTMLRAIGLIKQMIQFYPIEYTLSIIEADIMKGIPLHQSLAAFTVYPNKMVALVKAGEEVNKLDFFFNRLSKQYTDEAEHQSAVLGSMIEPFIIIFLGILVGVILIAMYLPLFQLGQNL